VSARTAIIAAAALSLALFPLFGGKFGVDFVTKTMVFAILALSLELLVGQVGLICFGQAAFFGIGAYAVVLLTPKASAAPVLWLLPAAVAAAASYALVVGALSLRTRGVYFIMITLAFAQMVYYVAIGLDRYGGDDGMTIYKRSQFGDLINLSNKTAFYYLCLVLLLVAVYIVWRIVNSRFGMVIQGARSNDRRMRAIGFPTYRYKLVCFVIAGTMCGLAGALLANHTDFISPAVMHWTRSGDLIVMAVLGGMGTVFGPVIGAVALLVLEEVLSGVTEYWQIIMGPIFLLVVLFARGGIDGVLLGARRD